MDPMLNVQRLRLLVELADRGTITAVADALHYTASTVSAALAALEREVGVPLLERTPRSVRLTPAGKALAAHGREIVTRLGVARSEARAAGGADRLAIATFSSAGATLVAGALARLRLDRSDLRIEVVEAEPAEALASLRAGEVDLAVVYDFDAEPVPPGADVALELLREEPVVACLPPSVELAAGERLALADLRGRRFVAGSPGTPCHAYTTAACRAAGFEPDIAFETGDVALTCALVEADFGVALMARSLAATAPVPVRVAELAPSLPPRRSRLARRIRAARSEAVDEVVGALAAAA